MFCSCYYFIDTNNNMMVCFLTHMKSHNDNSPLRAGQGTHMKISFAICWAEFTHFPFKALYLL